MEQPTISLIDAKTVNVGDRIRHETGDIKELMDSLESTGQIQPIVLDGMDLLAGYRRLASCLLLESEGRAIKGHEPGMILAIQKENLDPYTKLVIEFEENIRRKQFTRAEEALAISRLKVALEQIDPEHKPIPGGQLAKLLGYSKGHVSMALSVADAVENDGRKELLKSASIFGAYKKLRSIEKIEELTARVRAAEQAGSLAKINYKEFLHHGDAVRWLDNVADESVDFVHFDPPWGIGIDSYDRTNNYGTFADDADTGTRITEALIPELYRVLKPDTYMVVWFGIQFYQPLFDKLTTAGFKVHPVPYIWFKPNKGGAQNDSSRTVINQWEPCFICEKGEPRMFKFASGNVLSFDMPRERIHFAQKSVELMRELLERFTFGPMVVLDPTFGSGSVFVAAQRLGRVFIGCEKDHDNYENAIAWLSRSRLSI